MKDKVDRTKKAEHMQHTMGTVLEVPGPREGHYMAGHYRTSSS